MAPSIGKARLKRKSKSLFGAFFDKEERKYGILGALPISLIMHKNKKWLGIFALFFLVSLAFLPLETSAQTQYQLLEKIPGLENVGSNLGQYLKGLYTTALAIIVLSAVLMLSIGGFMYLTSAGNTAAMGTAKTIILDSIIGLILALVAYLILFVINPDLVKGTLPSLVPGSAAPAPTPAGTPSPVTLPASTCGNFAECATQIRQSANITLNGSGSCGNQSGPVTPQKNIQEAASGTNITMCSPGCTANSGCNASISVSANMLAAIARVGQVHRFTITSIAGGSHAGSSTHYKGRAIDVAPASQALLDAFRAAGFNANSFCEAPSGGRVPSCNPAQADHIHLEF